MIKKKEKNFNYRNEWKHITEDPRYIKRYKSIKEYLSYLISINSTQLTQKQTET